MGDRLLAVEGEVGVREGERAALRVGVAAEEAGVHLPERGRVVAAGVGATGRKLGRVEDVRAGELGDDDVLVLPGVVAVPLLGRGEDDVLRADRVLDVLEIEEVAVPVGAGFQVGGGEEGVLGDAQRVVDDDLRAAFDRQLGGRTGVRAERGDGQGGVLDGGIGHREADAGVVVHPVLREGHDKAGARPDNRLVRLADRPRVHRVGGRLDRAAEGGGVVEDGGIGDPPQLARVVVDPLVRGDGQRVAVDRIAVCEVAVGVVFIDPGDSGRLGVAREGGGFFRGEGGGREGERAGQRERGGENGTLHMKSLLTDENFGVIL